MGLLPGAATHCCGLDLRKLQGHTIIASAHASGCVVACAARKLGTAACLLQEVLQGALA